MKTCSALLIILHFFCQFNLSHAEEKIISLEKDKNIILNGNFIQGGLVYVKSIPKTSIIFMKLLSILVLVILSLVMLSVTLTQDRNESGGL